MRLYHYVLGDQSFLKKAGLSIYLAKTVIQGAKGGGCSSEHSIYLRLVIILLEYDNDESRYIMSFPQDLRCAENPIYREAQCEDHHISNTERCS